MQDLSDVLAQCLDEIEENNYSIDDVVETYPADADELKSLLHVADRVRKVRNNDNVSAEVRTRSRFRFFKRLK